MLDSKSFNCRTRCLKKKVCIVLMSAFPVSATCGLTVGAAVGLGAIGLGAVAGMAGVKAETATRMAEGALTVQLHGIGKTLMATWAPDVNMSAYLGYYGSGYNPVDDPDWQGGMGTYIPDISADDLSMDEGGFGMYEEAGAEFAW